MPRRPRILTFSNAVSILALFVALGGTAYATGVIAPGSVGTPQLRDEAVTAGKIAQNAVGHKKLKREAVSSENLAPESVGPAALTAGVRRLLAPSGARSTESAIGPAGPEGPAGAAGKDGDDATRVHYRQSATTEPPTASIVDIAGMRMEGACEKTEAGVQLNLAVRSAAAATGLESISVDQGSGEPSFASSQTANLQFSLPAGTTNLGGPSAQTGEYARVFANLVYVAPASTVHLVVGLTIDATTNTCSAVGVGIVAH